MSFVTFIYVLRSIYVSLVGKRLMMELLLKILASNGWRRLGEMSWSANHFYSCFYHILQSVKLRVEYQNWAVTSSFADLRLYMYIHYKSWQDLFNMFIAVA